MVIPWISIIILILIVLLGVVFWKRRKLRKKTNYKEFLTMGIVFLAFGLVFEYGMHNEYSTMTFLGIIFILSGALNWFLTKKDVKAKK